MTGLQPDGVHRPAGEQRQCQRQQIGQHQQKRRQQQGQAVGAQEAPQPQQGVSSALLHTASPPICSSAIFR